MASPDRKAKPTVLALQEDALTLLKILVPSRKAYGLFLSELIRREVDVRSNRLRLAQELETAVGHHV